MPLTMEPLQMDLLEAAHWERFIQRLVARFSPPMEALNEGRELERRLRGQVARAIGFDIDTHRQIERFVALNFAAGEDFIFESPDAWRIMTDPRLQSWAKLNLVEELLDLDGFEG